ncbi:MAG: hypothetical protein ACO23C_00470 [Prochlorococcaceae cyanobacterium]
MTTTTFYQATERQELSDQDLQNVNGGWFFLAPLFKLAAKKAIVAIFFKSKKVAVLTGLAEIESSASRR